MHYDCFTFSVKYLEILLHLKVCYITKFIIIINIKPRRSFNVRQRAEEVVSISQVPWRKMRFPKQSLPTQLKI